jgi:AraC family ethanolamine operon transcriptional activator
MSGLTASEAWAGTLEPKTVERTQLERGDLRLERSIAELACARFVSCDGNVGYRGHSDLSAGRAIVGVTADSSTDARWFGQSIDPADIVQTETSMDFTAYGPSKMYYVAIDAATLEPNDGRPVYRNAEFAERLRSYARAAIRPFRDGLRNSERLRGIERTLLPLLSLCLSDDGAFSAPVVLSRRVAAVRTCEEYVREHIDENPTLSELCTVSGLRARSLINAFQAVIGMSPMSYLRMQRLSEVRRALLTFDPAETRVIEVASTWGFWHMGHFAGSYREMFGESPSDTLNRRRGSQLPAVQGRL